MVVREREYDVVSWHGLKTITSLVVAVVGVVVAVLTAYYTAEASQNDRIAKHAQDLATQSQRVESNEKGLSQTLQKFDTTLIEQRKILDETKQAVTRIDTRQQVLIREVEKISDKLDRRNP
jgi:septal ring factor EnvC (AmiA/AmiB activator)